MTYAGERFDIVLIANQTPNVYWIRFKGLVNCDERYKSAFQVGVLEYSQEDEGGVPDSVPTYENSERGGKVNVLILHSLQSFLVMIEYFL